MPLGLRHHRAAGAHPEAQFGDANRHALDRVHDRTGRQTPFAPSLVNIYGGSRAKLNQSAREVQ